MARNTRIEIPDTLYYVILNGNQKQRIFHDNQDGQAFLDRIARYKERYGFSLYAYVLMPSAIYLLLENSDTPLAKVMQGIQQSYTQYYNKKYSIHGHVFQGRYQAYIVEKEKYFLELVRHIHLLPVFRRFAVKPDVYVWTGYYELFERRPGEPLIHWKSVLEYFSSSIPEALRKYHEFINDGMNKEFAFPIEDGQIIGSKRFAEEIYRHAGLVNSDKSKKSSVTLEKLTGITSELLSIQPEEIHSSARYHNVTAARRAIMYMAVEKLHFRSREVAEFFSRSEACVSLQILKAKNLLRNDEKIKSLFQELEQRIDKEN